MALGLALQSNLAVELGLNDTLVAVLNFWSAVLSALGCVAGGWLSDRLGRRRMLALYIFAMSLPTFYLAYVMQKAGWILPISTTAANRPVPAAHLVAMFWATTLVYNVFNGLMYGTRTALFMDVTTPKVAATQFTAYMAILNLSITLSANWQGIAVERWGYPITLAIDGVLGVLGLVMLPWMAKRRHEPELPGMSIPEATPI